MKQVKTLSVILLVGSLTQTFAATNMNDSDQASIRTTPPRQKRAVFNATAFLSPSSVPSPGDGSVVAAVDSVVGGGDTSSKVTPARSTRRQVFNAAEFLSLGSVLLPGDGSVVAAVDSVVGGGDTSSKVTPPRQKRAVFNAAAFLQPDVVVPDPFTETSPSKLGGGKVKSKSKLAALKVHPTPLMSRWMDAAEANRDLVGLSAEDAGEILLYFASYLDKVKRRGHEKEREYDPYTGNLGSRTYLSEVNEMRRKLTTKVGGPGVLAEAVKFINNKKSSFFKSLTSQKVVD